MEAAACGTSRPAWFDSESFQIGNRTGSVDGLEFSAARVIPVSHIGSFVILIALGPSSGIPKQVVVPTSRERRSVLHARPGQGYRSGGLAANRACPPDSSDVILQGWPGRSALARLLET